MKTHCEYCGKEFVKVTGSSRYCPGKICYNEAKKNRQKNVDDLIKSFRRGVYRNFKIFHQLLPNIGNIQKPLKDVQSLGFDEHAYYQSLIDQNKIVWYFSGPYLFSIDNRTETSQLIIYKR